MCLSFLCIFYVTPFSFLLLTLCVSSFLLLSVWCVSYVFLCHTYLSLLMWFNLSMSNIFFLNVLFFTTFSTDELPVIFLKLWCDTWPTSVLMCSYFSLSAGHFLYWGWTRSRPKMFGDDLNQCLHMYCHGLVAIYLHKTKALFLFLFITLAFEIYRTCFDGKDVY